MSKSSHPQTAGPSAPPAASPTNKALNLKRFGLIFAVTSAALVFLLYRNIIGAPFVYDDQAQVQTNSYLLSWHSVFAHYVAAAHTFSSEYRGSGGIFYRPLFWLALACERQLFGLNVAGFHITSLLFDWANALLAFILLRRLGVSQIVSAATALIWLALPINSEAVAWISGQAYLLVTFFVLVALIFAGQYLRKPHPLALVCYCVAHLAALLSHEAGVLVLPFVVLLARARKARPLYIASTGITVVYVLARAGLLGFSAGPHSWSIWPLGSALLKYLGWIILPVHMSIERSTETPPDAASLANVICLCVVALLIAAAWRFRRSLPETAGGFAWTIIALAPFCGFFFLYQGMAERYAYLASIGLALAIASAASKITGIARIAVVCVAALWFGWGAWRLDARVRDWHDETALYASSLKTDPDSPVLLTNLASTLSDEGHLTEALLFLNRAIAVKPDYELAYRDLGNVYLQLGVFEQAKKQYEKAVALDPNDIRAITNLGSAYVRLKDLAGAEREFRRAIRLAPNTVGPYCDLGIVLFYRGKTDEALQQFATGIRLDAADPNPYYFLGFVEEQTGARDAARQMYEKALQLKPDYAQARVGLERLQKQR